LLAVNVLAGFAYADVADTGVCFSALTLGDEDAARRALRGLCATAWEHRATGCPAGVPISAAMARLSREQTGPILLVEPADNIGGGAPGDLTTVLRALVENRVPRSAACINDPEAVRRLWDAATGKRVRLAIGGKSKEIGSEPLVLDLTVVSRSSGRFALEDSRSHMASMVGTHVDMGPCAVARHGDTTVLLTSRRTPPFDLGQWRSQGIDPERLLAINVKAAVAHRQAYDPIAAASYTIDSPGPCDSDLRRLPYRHIRRPIYPLDTGAEYAEHRIG
jgi:microcystin degradation protein MlrC